jgi:hypothetical protein
MTGHYCPNCGNALSDVELDVPHRYLPPEGGLKCKKCEWDVIIVDRSSMDQEGYIEVVYH